jgi:hypothetical protein
MKLVASYSQFCQFSDEKGTLIGIDFGIGSDFVVESTFYLNSDKSLTFISSNIIGQNMSEVEKREVIEKYKKL